MLYSSGAAGPEIQGHWKLHEEESKECSKNPPSHSRNENKRLSSIKMISNSKMKRCSIYVLEVINLSALSSQCQRIMLYE